MNETLWRRIEAALDARVDPFDDPDLLAALAPDPEAERAARRLASLLALLDDSTVARSRPGRARRIAAVAAAVLLFTTGIALIDRHSGGAAALTPREPIRTVSLTLERTLPPPARGARVVLEPRHVMEWSLEGDAP